VASVKRSLEGLDRVEEASPNLASGLVRVRGEHLDVVDLRQAVEEAGFKVVENSER
jgi:copper chaperone CopZ